MQLERRLSASDHLRVQDTLGRLSARVNRALTLPDLLDEWRRFVVSIAQGYGWSMDTYNKDLAVRDWIEEVSEALSMEGRRLLGEAVRDADEDFIRATYDPERPESLGPPQIEIGWWQYRIPSEPLGQLRHDLIALGHDFSPLEQG